MYLYYIYYIYLKFYFKFNNFIHHLAHTLQTNYPLSNYSWPITISLLISKDLLHVIHFKSFKYSNPNLQIKIFYLYFSKDLHVLGQKLHLLSLDLQRTRQSLHFSGTLRYNRNSSYWLYSNNFSQQIHTYLDFNLPSSTH